MLQFVGRMAPPRRGLLLRRTVLFLSAALCVVGLYWIGRAFVVNGKVRFGNPVARELPADVVDADYDPRHVRAEVTHVEGNHVVSPGDKCEFLIERRARDRNSFYCNAQVVCGGRLIYGGPDRGYFTCRLFEEPRRDVVGSDPNTTKDDQDGAIHLDTRAGVLRIWDDARGPLGAFRVEADVLSVQ
jgi:hypothetical protein